MHQNTASGFLHIYINGTNESLMIGVYFSSIIILFWEMFQYFLKILQNKNIKF